MATRLGMIRPKKGITPMLTITTLVIIETIIKPKNIRLYYKKLQDLKQDLLPYLL